MKEKTCPSCGGAGGEEPNTCYECGGSGTITSKEEDPDAYDRWVEDGRP